VTLEDLEITDTKTIRYRDSTSDDENDELLRAINVINKKRGFCEYIPNSIAALKAYIQLAFGVTLSTTTNGNMNELTLYAVQSQVLGTRLLPAEMFVMSFSESVSQTKRFKVIVFITSSSSSINPIVIIIDRNCQYFRQRSH